MVRYVWRVDAIDLSARRLAWIKPHFSSSPSVASANFDLIHSASSCSERMSVDGSALFTVIGVTSTPDTEFVPFPTITSSSLSPKVSSISLSDYNTICFSLVNESASSFRFSMNLVYPDMMFITAFVTF